MKFVILFMSIIPGMIVHSACSIKMCLRWTKSPGILKIICKIDDLHLPVSIHNNNDKEIALCSIPFPSPTCTGTYNYITVKQNVHTNETEVTVRGHIDHRMSGNWSCRHGKGRNDYEAYIEIIIPTLNEPKNTEENDDFHCLKELSLNAVMGIVITLVILIILFAIYKYTFSLQRGQHKKEIIPLADDIDQCFKIEKCPKLSETDTKIVFFMCLLLVMLIGGVLFWFLEKDSCNGSYTFIILGMLLCVLCVVLFYREKVLREVSVCNINDREKAHGPETIQLQEINTSGIDE